MTDDLAKLMRDAFSMFRTKIVESDAQAQEEAAKMEADGFRLAAASNAGLPPGKVRLTFLPASAFKKEAAK